MIPAPDLVIDKDYVILEGVQVNRPRRISVLQWLRAWERVQAMWEKSH